MYLDKVLKAFNEYDEVVTAAREIPSNYFH